MIQKIDPAAAIMHHAVEPLEAGVERENWEIP